MREALALAMGEDAEQFEVQSESTLDAKLMSWSSAIKKGFVIDNIQGLESASVVQIIPLQRRRPKSYH